jgi:hypothetical protein
MVLILFAIEPEMLYPLFLKFSAALQAFLKRGAKQGTKIVGFSGFVWERLGIKKPRQAR